MTPSRTCALLAAALTCAPAALAAQAPAPAAASCPAPLEPSPNRFISDTLTLTLDPGYGVPPQPEGVGMVAAQAVADLLQLPSPLPLPPVMMDAYESPGGAIGRQGFVAEAFVELGKNGKVRRTGLTQTSLLGAIDRALVAAVQAAADSGVFAPYAAAARGPGGYLFFQLRTVPLPPFKAKAKDFERDLPPNPLNIMDHPTKPPAKGEITQVPVRALRIPMVRLTSAAQVPKNHPEPVFPHDELYAHQDGFVNFEFVVGGDGKVVPGALRFANAMTPGFARAIANALDGYRFIPATANGCGVPQRLWWTWTFQVY